MGRGAPSPFTSSLAIPIGHFTPSPPISPHPLPTFLQIPFSPPSPYLQTNQEAEEMHFSVEEQVSAKAGLDDVEDDLVDMVRGRGPTG